MAQRSAILKAARLLKGKSTWINPNYTKAQATEQYELRQQRRQAISQGQKAYFKAGRLIVASPQSTQPNASANTTGAATTAAATSSSPQ